VIVKVIRINADDVTALSLTICKGESNDLAAVGNDGARFQVSSERRGCLTDPASAAAPNVNIRKHTFPLKTGRRQLQALVRPHSVSDSA